MLAKQITAWLVLQEQQERLQEQQLRQQQERLQEQRQERLQQALGQQQRERLQVQRLLLFYRKRSKQRRPTKRRTKRIWSW